MIYMLACSDCQQIDSCALLVDADVPRWSSSHPFAAGHDGHRLTLVDQDQADADVPWPGWTPRPVHGPPLPGHSQPVACPLCNAVGVDGAGRASTVVWKRTEAGDPFVFCRSCGFTWGPGADAERHRMLLRSLGRTDAR